MSRYFAILLLVLTNSVYAQTNLEVKVLANNEEIILGQPFVLGNQTYELHVIKFYITNVKLLNKGEVIADFSNSPNLINLEDDTSTIIPLSVLADFDEINFTFGVDSATNVNGIMTGALDPVNGMYWTWQSGYINCKIEGQTIQENRKNIEYHLGGYLPNQLAAQNISLPVDSNTQLVLEFHIDAILSGLNDKQLFQIMSPGENAMLASGLLYSNIKIHGK